MSVESAEALKLPINKWVIRRTKVHVRWILILFTMTVCVKKDTFM